MEQRTTVHVVFRFRIRAKSATAGHAELKRLRLDAVKLAKKYRGVVRIVARRYGGGLP